jgi:hypothetical protein
MKLKAVRNLAVAWLGRMVLMLLIKHLLKAGRKDIFKQ